MNTEKTENIIDELNKHFGFDSLYYMMEKGWKLKVFFNDNLDKKYNKEGDAQFEKERFKKKEEFISIYENIALHIKYWGIPQINLNISSCYDALFKIEAIDINNLKKEIWLDLKEV